MEATAMVSRVARQAQHRAVRAVARVATLTRRESVLQSPRRHRPPTSSHATRHRPHRSGGRLCGAARPVVAIDRSARRPRPLMLGVTRTDAAPAARSGEAAPAGRRSQQQRRLGGSWASCGSWVPGSGTWTGGHGWTGAGRMRRPATPAPSRLATRGWTGGGRRQPRAPRRRVPRWWASLIRRPSRAPSRWRSRSPAARRCAS
jgi:hypothetical protein